ncbi:MAG: hypothetical protein V3T78_10105 [Dehalococcoidia bacterium]
MVIEATKISNQDPTVQPMPESTSLAPRPTSLDGATVGLLANGKRNSEELLRAVYSLLQDIYQFKGVVELNKGDVSRPAPKQIMDPLLEKSDLVITAIGD